MDGEERGDGTVTSEQVPPWDREVPAPPVRPITLTDMAREDPAALAALGLTLGVALVLAGSLIAGLRSSVTGAVGTSTSTGFRLRLLAVFDAARLETAVASVVAVAVLGLTSVRPGRAQARRPLLVAIGA